MEIGKVPNDVLQAIVLDKIKNKRKEILIRPRIGEDCCAIDYGEYACVLSCDPITGAIHEIGRLAVHISCNDIAACGVEPLGLMVAILVPPDTGMRELDTIMQQLCDTASSLDVDILGGHTEVTASVTRPVIVTTAVGKVLKGKLVTSSGAQPGDRVLLTKTAGIEGTAILAGDKEEELVKALGKDMVERAKGFINRISVVKEGVIAGRFGVSSMHDVTEGGVLGAAWELAQASGRGIRLYREKIPVAPETSAIAGFYGINPLKLISSGCMLITSERAEELLNVLNGEGVEASIIGEITEENSRLLVQGTSCEEITQPESDALYKAI